MKRTTASTIPPEVLEEVSSRLREMAARQYGRTCRDLIFRTRGPFLYIDAYRTEDMPNTPVLHLCWIEWTGDPESWGFGFYRYARNRYERSVTIPGSGTGTPEECFATAAFAYLRESPFDNPSGTFGGVD